MTYKVAYFFLSRESGILKLIQKILPELENGTHSLNVVAMCFFDDNAIVLELNNRIGQRLATLAKEKDIILLKGEITDMNPIDHARNEQKTKDQIRLKPTECVVITVVDGEQVGIYPDFYSAMGKYRPERIISI
jgi:hypothetical protein